MHLVAKCTNLWISYCKDVLKAFDIGRSSNRDSDARSPRMIRHVYASSGIASSRLCVELNFIYGKVTANLRRNVFAFDCRPRGSSAKGFFLSPLFSLHFFPFWAAAPQGTITYGTNFLRFFRVYLLIFLFWFFFSLSFPPEAESGAESEALLAGFRSLPAASRVLPAGSAVLPAGSKAHPAGPKAIPALSEALLACSEALPTGSKALSAASAVLPSLSHPSQSLPNNDHYPLRGRCPLKAKLTEYNQIRNYLYFCMALSSSNLLLKYLYN